ncbi:MAG: Holliday junction branch migration protein RuvA [Actinobacteria bacterium]|nr:Holliday junction branch migration protein RuvA [Actinomycetota bacterium]
MIALLRGRLVSRRSTGDAIELVVETGGVGYRVTVPAGLAGRIVPDGDEVEVHTSMQVREDAMDLYGFPSVDTRDLFELLITVSGVGPKLGQAILGTLAPESLRRAVGDGDVDALTVVPGIGKKSAQRLVLELKDKLATVTTGVDLSVVGGDTSSSNLGEVRLALLELGYSNAEAQRAVERLADDGDVSEMLRTALRSLAMAGS